MTNNYTTSGGRIAQAQDAISNRASADQLGLLGYTYLMGITQTWLFAPRLFSLKQQAPFFRDQFWQLMGGDRQERRGD